MNAPRPEQKADLLKRLARVEGQIRGVHKLVEADTDCDKVLQQMTAARKALDRAFYEMMACLVEAAVTSTQDPADLPARVAEVRSLLSRYA